MIDDGTPAAGTLAVRRRLLGALALLLGIGAIALASAPSAHAFCQGNSCLPGSGYTLDTTFNCGVISSSQVCFANGTTIISNAVSHSWGFGSASYSGSGTITVCVNAENSSGTLSFWGACGSNLARACALDSCNDQDSSFWVLGVFHDSSNPHTIFGHGEA